MVLCRGVGGGGKRLTPDFFLFSSFNNQKLHRMTENFCHETQYLSAARLQIFFCPLAPILLQLFVVYVVEKKSRAEVCTNNCSSWNVYEEVCRNFSTICKQQNIRNCYCRMARRLQKKMGCMAKISEPCGGKREPCGGNLWDLAVSNLDEKK